MPFVKLDTRILDSSLWIDRGCKDIFITSLLLAEPKEFTEPQQQIAVRSITYTGFIVPPGWYGFVAAAAPGIIRRALMETKEGMDALEALGNPDPESRSSDFEGRRLVRIDGGYIVLNYMKYREFDHTAATRMKKMRARKKSEITAQPVTPNTPVTQRNSYVTLHIADADADAEVRGNTNTLDYTKSSADTQSACATPQPGDAGQPLAELAPSGVRLMPPPSWILTEAERNLVDIVLIGSPPGLVAELSAGIITPVHRDLVIRAVRREAEEHKVSYGEALDGILHAVRNQAANIPFERLNLCGGLEKYFNKSTYRKDPIHFQERSNGATSKSAGTIAAARIVLAKDRAKDASRLAAENGTTAGMHALARRLGTSQG